MDNAALRLRQRLARPEPLVMGVLNVTPDSFSDGGRYMDIDVAVDRAREMGEQGAELIDIGGESTRPGSEAVPLEEERRRVLPLLEALAERVAVPLSIDTSKPEIMTEAGAAGVALINDVRALQAPGALPAVAALDASVCVMHMQGEPRSMQTEPHYDNVVRDVGDFLEERVAVCVEAGIGRERIVADPGFGFGKTLDHNLSLLRHFGQLVERLDLPLLAGMSRKRMIGTLTGGVPAAERLYGSLAAAVLAAASGARVLRVHDVRPTVEALAIVQATIEAE
ncbi:MAG: dihydropteroate synthase [Halofilum sp. (in: g-proteobacteria)]